jgi:hypothetical protein
MTAIYLISFDPDTRDYYIHADGQIAGFAATYAEACAKQAELTTRDAKRAALVQDAARPQTDSEAAWLTMAAAAASR